MKSDNKKYNSGIIITQGNSLEEKIKKSSIVKPSLQQIQWQEMEFAGFIHFGMNVFSKRQWGTGQEDPKIFNPIECDVEQWIKVCKAAGMKMVIPTVKHHDGFCLWPTKTNDFNISQSPWKEGKGDIVKEISDACNKYDMKLGLYLSPWDRHDIHWDTPDYNRVYLEQIRELCTNYGEISEFWFDGACGDKEVFTRANYTFDEFYDLIEELQPNCVFRAYDPHLAAPGYEIVHYDSKFSGEYLKEQDLKWRGKEIRWAGNEEGRTRASEWSVVPITGPFYPGKTMIYEDIASREKLSSADALVWFPAETVSTLNGNWFWEEASKVKPLEELVDVYFNVIGGNSFLLLNVAPDNRGLIPNKDIEMLVQLRKYLDKTSEKNYAVGSIITSKESDNKTNLNNITDGNNMTYWTAAENNTPVTLEINLADVESFNMIMLQEFIREGQRIEKYDIQYFDGYSWITIFEGTIIGYKKIARFKEITTNKVRINILQSRNCPMISNFAIYNTPILPKVPKIHIDNIGGVTIETDSLTESIYYTLNGCEPDESSNVYSRPFTISQGVEVKVLSVYPQDKIWGHTRFMKSSKEFGMSKKNWKVIYTDSEMYPAKNAIDGNSTTNWMTKDVWNMLITDDRGYNLPHEIQIDLSEVIDISGFVYLPNQQSSQGHIYEYEFYVSLDKENWGEPIVKNTFDNTANDPRPQKVKFKNKVLGRYIRLLALSTVDKTYVVAVAELDLLVN